MCWPLYVYVYASVYAVCVCVFARMCARVRALTASKHPARLTPHQSTALTGIGANSRAAKASRCRIRRKKRAHYVGKAQRDGFLVWVQFVALFAGVHHAHCDRLHVAYTHIHIHTYTYTYVYILAHTHTHTVHTHSHTVCVCVCVCVFTSLYIICLGVYMYMYVGAYKYMYVGVLYMYLEYIYTDRCKQE